MAKIIIRPDPCLLLELYKWAHAVCNQDADCDDGSVMFSIVSPDRVIKGREILEKLKEDD